MSQNKIEGIGVDIEKIKRFRDLSDHFLNSIFTKGEIKYCKNKKNFAESFAGNFCAKEAVIKAYNKKILMCDIEVILDKGKIKVYLKGKYQKKIHCSISHSEDKAIAYVIIEK